MVSLEADGPHRWCQIDVRLGRGILSQSAGCRSRGEQGARVGRACLVRCAIRRRQVAEPKDGSAPWSAGGTALRREAVLFPMRQAQSTRMVTDLGLPGVALGSSTRSTPLR